MLNRRRTALPGNSMSTALRSARSRPIPRQRTSPRTSRAVDVGAQSRRRLARLRLGRRAMFARRARRGIEAPVMNAPLATMFAAGIYIGGGVILAILIIVVLILLLRR
jgi:hypothetical protein